MEHPAFISLFSRSLTTYFTRAIKRKLDEIKGPQLTRDCYSGLANRFPILENTPHGTSESHRQAWTAIRACQKARDNINQYQNQNPDATHLPMDRPEANLAAHKVNTLAQLICSISSHLEISTHQSSWDKPSLGFP